MKGKIIPMYVFDGKILTKKKYDKIKRKFLKEHPEPFAYYKYIFEKFFQKGNKTNENNLKGEKNE